MDPIRLIIADDSRQFGDGLRALLSSAIELIVIVEVVNGERAVAMATALQPNVIMTDLQMPGVGGIEATRRILRQPHISILVLSMFDDDSIFAALQAGARGSLLKGARKSKILRAVLAVATGEAIFGPAIARRLIDFFATPRPSAPRRGPPRAHRTRTPDPRTRRATPLDPKGLDPSATLSLQPNRSASTALKA